MADGREMAKEQCMVAIASSSEIRRVQLQLFATVEVTV